MLDDPRIVAAAISVLGAIISILTSTAVTLFSIRNDIRKLKLSMYNSFADKLLEKRLSSYPELYAVASDFIKKAGKDASAPYNTNITIMLLSDIAHKVSDWDSKNAILMSSRSQHLMWQFRCALNMPIKNSGNDNAVISESALDQILESAKKLELGLKSDIGIFAVEAHAKSRFFINFHDIYDTWEHDERTLLQL